MPQRTQVRSRTIAGAVLALLLATAGCVNEPDRSAKAEALGRSVDRVPGTSRVRVSYTPDSVEFNEGLEVYVDLEPGQTPARGCAPVAAVLSELATSGIPAEATDLEIRDQRGDPRWRFLAPGEVSPARAVDQCRRSWEVRGVEGVYAVSVYGAAAGSRPGVTLHQRGPDPAVDALASARRLPHYDDFGWRLYVVCGTEVCPTETPG